MVSHLLKYAPPCAIALFMRWPLLELVTTPAACALAMAPSKICIHTSVAEAAHHPALCAASLADKSGLEARAQSLTRMMGDRHAAVLISSVIY